MNFLRRLLRWDHSTDWWIIAGLIGFALLELARLHQTAPKPTEMPAVTGRVIPT